LREITRPKIVRSRVSIHAEIKHVEASRNIPGRLPDQNEREVFECCRDRRERDCELWRGDDDLSDELELSDPCRKISSH
jgi:hypothetical protein